MRVPVPVLVTTTLLLVYASIAAQSAPQVDSPQAPAFEVVSVKPNRSNAPGQSMQGDPRRVTSTNVPVEILIIRAYNVHPDNILNGPSWIRTERFDVEAKVADIDIVKQRQNPLMRNQMMQTLLRERFGLVVREVAADAPGYALVLARSDSQLGPQMTPSVLDCASLRCEINSDAIGTLRGRGMSIQRLAGFLGRDLGGVVTDRTGLEGLYDFQLSWVPERLRASLTPAENPIASSTPAGPSIFTAVVEQLGLKLQPEKDPRGGLLIERIERPTPN